MIKIKRLKLQLNQILTCVVKNYHTVIILNNLREILTRVLKINVNVLKIKIMSTNLFLKLLIIFF